jgi:hypothetical protein
MGGREGRPARTSAGLTEASVIGNLLISKQAATSCASLHWQPIPIVCGTLNAVERRF